MDDAKRFEILANIMRASHFEWRRAALAQCPESDPAELVRKYWEEVGKDTAIFYLKKIDPDTDLARQVSQLVVSSSLAMGEDAVVLEDPLSGCFQVCHNACPWYFWHKKEGLLEEDQMGCDHWLTTVVDEINRALGSALRFETLESLPAGDTRCLRRFWEEKR